MSTSHNEPPIPAPEGAPAGYLEKRADELVRLVYPDIRRRARWLMKCNQPGPTFGPSGSELVQRVLMRLLGSDGTAQMLNVVETKEELVFLLSRRMRDILVDYWRSKGAEKAPPRNGRVDFEDAKRTVAATTFQPDKLLLVHELLLQLEATDPQAATAVQFTYFDGLTGHEAAAAMGLPYGTLRHVRDRGMDFLKGRMGVKSGSLLPSGR